MNDFGTDRSKPWSIYTSPDPSSSSQPAIVDHDTPWTNFGTSMNAISFGFVATAILISMFLIMAIFEHLFRPSTFSSPEDVTNIAVELGGSTRKLGNMQTVVPMSYASDFSVVMPGQQHPTFIAQPAPLPCSRERIYWPSHEQNFVYL